MEKKNPYITTIGFKKDDPEHVYVAKLLNTLGRGKAQYIVKAVLVYQELQKKGEVPTIGNFRLDYENVRKIVLQVLDEREENMQIVENSVKEQKAEKENDLLSRFDEDALNGIMASIAAFQQQ